MGVFAVSMLENAIVFVSKVGSFDKPVFGLVFKCGLFDVGCELAYHASIVEFGMRF